MKAVDLFAGCGGLSLGFQNAGFEIVGAFERWRVAAVCYEANFAHPVCQEDLSEVGRAAEIIRRLDPEIILGGPPCQDFSHAGKRIEDKRAALTEAFAKIVAEISPRYFVMENVDRAQNSATYAAARAILKNAGYGLTETVLNASYCGVPQRRKRFFCIGAKGAGDHFLDSCLARNLSETEMTLREYFGATLDFEYYYRHPRNYSRRAVYSIDEPSPTVRGINRPVPPGYPGHPNDARELDSSIRALTTLERALIQTFPPNFKWAGNKTETEQMIGNAVPVKLAEFVANALNGYIAKERQVVIDYGAFYAWLCHAKAVSERTKRDIVSRLRRADSFCAILSDPGEYYVFMLEQTESYKALPVSVRSQLKHAVGLYSDYRKSCAG